MPSDDRHAGLGKLGRATRDDLLEQAVASLARGNAVMPERKQRRRAPTA